jgi:hypothetical protein
MATELAESKSRQKTSSPASEGADLSTSETSGKKGGSVVMDDMISLTLPQAIQLRGLYQARKEVEEKIHFGEQMLGVGDREIVSGDLGDENPHLMLRPRPSAIIS